MRWRTCDASWTRSLARRISSQRLSGKRYSHPRTRLSISRRTTTLSLYTQDGKSRGSRHFCPDQLRPTTDTATPTMTREDNGHPATSQLATTTQKDCTPSSAQRGRVFRPLSVGRSEERPVPVERR